MLKPARLKPQDVALYACRAVGLFRVARWVTRRGVRILCYHGFSLGDEVDFRPGLFITPSTFEGRLAYLRDHGYPVVSLTEAVEALASGRQAGGLTVITVDDVFASFTTTAVPIARSFGMPMTAYLTTYYAQKRTPVFRLVVRYMFWRTTRRTLDLHAIAEGLSDVLDLEQESGRRDAEEAVISYGERQASEDRRVEMSRALGRVLGVDYDQLVRARTFDIVTLDEARSLAAAGIDVELHTHRHRLLPVEAEVCREIEDNRRALATVRPGPIVHLCYPSGIWSAALWPWLTAAGIATATTCDAGFNYPSTPRLALRRTLDAEDVPQIRFEAEVSGFKELVRRALGRGAPPGRAAD